MAIKRNNSLSTPITRKFQLVSCLILAILVSSTILASGVRAQTTSSQTLVLGVVSPPPVTFATSSSDEFIGTTATQIPYLLLSPLALNGSAVPGVAHPPVLVPGSNGLEWDINLISPNLKWSDGVP